MSWTLITGGSRKLGAKMALQLAEQKRDLVIHYRTSEKEALALVKKLQKLGVKAQAIQGDFTTAETTQDFIKRYLKQFGKTKALVYNVGNSLRGAATEIAPGNLNELFQTNVTSAMALIQALLPSLKHEKGEILTIGMVGSSAITSNSYAFGYNLSKQALWMLTKSLAKELAPHQVRVNMVSPGYMEESVELPEKMNQIPAGRLATFDEVARAVAFLMDPASSYITGQNLEVAGGVRL
jgi:NAD(P)-dependent dehydrogenase (short-subunit alcohol dehydrogenase family)